MTFNFKTKKGRREVYWTMYAALVGVGNRWTYNESYDCLYAKTKRNFPIYGLCNLADTISNGRKVFLPELLAQKPKRINTDIDYWWPLEEIKTDIKYYCEYDNSLEYNKKPRLKALLAAIELTYK
jgi:hypothetical protein